VRFLLIVTVLAAEAWPALAQACNKPHPSPENPTIILGIAGGSIFMWRYVRARTAKRP